jgi:hypothetical protein
MRRIYALVLLCLFCCTGAMADQATQCSPMDFVTTYKMNFTRDQALAYLDQIDRTNFSEAKHTFSAAGVIPFDVPIHAQGSYDDYSKWWSEFKRTTKFNYSSNETQAIVQTMVTANDLEKYKACVVGGLGLSAFLTQNENQAIVQIHWRPAPPVPGQTMPYSETVDLQAFQGDAVTPTTQRKDIVINGDFTVEYPLTKGVPFTLVASIGGSTSTTVHAFVPKLFTCTLQSPNVEALDPLSPRILANQRTNHYLDGNAHAWMADYAQRLRAQGKSVVSTRYVSAETVGSSSWIGGSKRRTYAVYIYATYGGDKVYGPDPRCLADQPPGSEPQNKI